MSRDEEGKPPLGALPTKTVELTDTDPDVFLADTKRICMNCGYEVGYDDAAYVDGETAVYVKMHAWLVANGINPVNAAHMVEAIRRS